MNEKRGREEKKREERQRSCEKGGPEAEEGWDRRGKVGTGDGEHTRNPKVAV